LSRLVEHYWEEHLPLGTAISPQYLADSRNVEQRYLNELGGISRDALDVQSKLTYDIFKRQREVLIEGFTYPAELLPFGAFDAVLQRLVLFAADRGQYPLSTRADYDNWLRRIDNYVYWTQQAIANMREGIRRGYTAPRSVVEHAIPMLARLSEDNASNVLFVPLRSMPDAIKEPDRAGLQALLSSAMTDKLLPANRALRDFLQREYLPRGRAGLGLSELPLGAKWYAYRLWRATDSTQSADEFHALGLAEVERIRTRLPPPREAQGGATPAVAAAELQSAYQDLSAQVAAALPTLFSESPKSDFGLRTTQWLQDSALPLHYEPGGPGGKPRAILYINTTQPWLRAGISQASFLQQAAPGQHLQMALQHERQDLPRIRRWGGGSTAYVEGWGLYAASLGEQLGLPTDDVSKADALALQLRCAVALVVDTGLHAKSWTLTQALDYLHAQMTIDDAGAQALVDEYARNPADALACMVGELKFVALRAKAQQVLAGHFDIHVFHSEILKDGAMPLDILDAKMKAWMDASR
jgi:uncharacterized protein (DUF885 family)